MFSQYLRSMAAVAMIAPATTIPKKRPVALTITIDASAAEAVLAAVTSDPSRVERLADDVIKLPAIQAMIAKDHKYFPDASEQSFRTALVTVARGGHSDQFPLEAIRANPQVVRALLDSLKAQRVELTSLLQNRLAAFTPNGLTIDTKLVVVLGSHQNGWVPDQSTPIFYVDAGFQAGDLGNLIASGAHELFHVVQSAVQPDVNPAFTELPPSPAIDHEMHNVHAALLNLLFEGLADYVGDPVLFPGSGPIIDRARKDYARNWSRSGENFELFNTIIYRFARDSTAQLGPLLNVGFGGSWGQSGYYVGYRMAKAIDRYAGRDRLKALAALPPEEFLKDYIAICKAHPTDPEVTALPQSTIDAVRASALWQSTPKHSGSPRGGG